MFSNIVEKFRIMSYNRKVRRLKKKYPDYQDDTFNDGATAFLFGVRDDYKSPIEGSNPDPASFATCNVFQLLYDRKNKQYKWELFISNARDEDREKQIEILKDILSLYEDWMLKRGHRTNFSKELWLWPITSEVENFDNAHDAYESFAIFVRGFEACVRRATCA